MQNKVYLFHNGENIFLIILAIERTSHESRIHTVMLTPSYTGTQVGRQLLLPTRDGDTNPQLSDCAQLVIPVIELDLIRSNDRNVLHSCFSFLSFLFWF